MKKFVFLFLTVMMLLSASALADEPLFSDGVYNSIQLSGDSQMTVTVTLDENLIKGISLTADEEMLNENSEELTGVLNAVLNGQTLAVSLDDVKCPEICQAILNGVEDCVKQSGCDASMLHTHHLCDKQSGYHHASGCASSHSSGSHHTTKKTTHHSESSSSHHNSGSSSSHHGSKHH